MNALDVIEQIKALPPAEQAQVVDFVHKLRIPAMEEASVPSADEEAFKTAAERVFDRYDELFRKLAQ